MKIENIGLVKIGTSLKHVQSLLDCQNLPEEKIIDGKEYCLYKFDDQGIQIFFDKNNNVRTVLIDSPCVELVRGVAIGMTSEQILDILGKPTRYWPVLDGVERWLYDGVDFLRVDFNPETNLINRLVR